MPQSKKTKSQTTAPIVSVVIPTFNRAGVVRAAVESALRQTLADLEVIVVDDGSVDTTQADLAAIADSRFRLLRHDVNRGAAAARNTGIRAARGNLIAFLDSDDTWLEDKLARQVAVLRAASKRDAVCCSGVFLHLIDHGVTRERRIAPSNNWLETLAVGCDLSPGSTQLTWRETFDRVGPLDETLPRFEDWDWLFRYALNGGGVAVISEPLAHVYNKRGRLGPDVEVSTQRFLAKHDEVLRALPRGIRDTCITDAWLQVVVAYGFEGHYARAVGPYWKAFQRQPFKCFFRATRGVLYALRGAALRGLR